MDYAKAKADTGDVGHEKKVENERKLQEKIKKHFRRISHKSGKYSGLWLIFLLALQEFCNLLHVPDNTKKRKEI